MTGKQEGKMKNKTKVREKTDTQNLATSSELGPPVLEATRKVGKRCMPSACYTIFISENFWTSTSVRTERY